MNRENLDFGIGQAIISCFFLWLFVFLWHEIPSYGFFWGICSLLLGLLMFSCTVVAITGFTSVQYEATRQFLSFAMGALTVFITHEMFDWRWNEWYIYVIALIELAIAAGIFNALLENKKLRQSFEALLITICCVNMLRIISLL